MEVPGLGLIEMLSATLPTARPSQTTVNHAFNLSGEFRSPICFHRSHAPLHPLPTSGKNPLYKIQKLDPSLFGVHADRDQPERVSIGAPPYRSPVRPAPTSHQHVHCIPWHSMAATSRVSPPTFHALAQHGTCFDPAMSRRSSATSARRQQTLFDVSDEPVELEPLGWSWLERIGAMSSQCRSSPLRPFFRCFMMDANRCF